MVLAVIHLLQPLNLVLTPLLFLTAGLSVAPGGEHARLELRRMWVVGAVSIALVLALGRFGASSLERYGRTYVSPGALQASRVLQPFRLSGTEALAKHRSLDARARRPGAGADARELAEEGVARHGWHPAVRLVAADVEMLLDDRPAARRWLDEHLERFPNDPVALGGAARLALEAGEAERARVLALRALEADPDLGLAEDVLEAVPTSSR